MRRRAVKATPPVEKVPFLEGLRGLAALYVVLGHLCSMADPSHLAGKASEAPIWLQKAMAPFAYGHLAVAAFIVISGFCLQLSLFHNGTGRIPSLRTFFKRRARRILPAYYACLGFSIIVCILVTERTAGMPFEMYVPLTWANVLSHLFLVHNLSLDWMYKINGVLWSIGVECQLYLLFPILILLRARIGRLGVVALTGLASWVVIQTVPHAPKLYPWYLALFTLGIVSAHYSYRPHLKKGTHPYLALVLAWPALIVCCMACADNAPIYVRDAWLGLGIASLFYAWSVRPSFRLARAFSWPPLVALGGFSYSLYLMHHPVEQVVFVLRPWFIQGEGLALGYLLVVGLPVILASCYLFSHLFEQPFISRKRVPRETVAPKGNAPCQLPLRTYSEGSVRALRAVVHANVRTRGSHRGQTSPRETAL